MELFEKNNSHFSEGHLFHVGLKVEIISSQGQILVGIAANN